MADIRNTKAARPSSARLRDLDDGPAASAKPTHAPGSLGARVAWLRQLARDNPLHTATVGIAAFGVLIVLLSSWWSNTFHETFYEVPCRTRAFDQCSKPYHVIKVVRDVETAKVTIMRIERDSGRFVSQDKLVECRFVENEAFGCNRETFVDTGNPRGKISPWRMANGQLINDEQISPAYYLNSYEYHTRLPFGSWDR